MPSVFPHPADFYGLGIEYLSEIPDAYDRFALAVYFHYAVVERTGSGGEDEKVAVRQDAVVMIVWKSNPRRQGENRE